MRKGTSAPWMRLALAHATCAVSFIVAQEVHAQPAAIDLSGGAGVQGGRACLTVSLDGGGTPAFAISVDLEFSGAPVSIAADMDCTLAASGADLVKACANRSETLLRCGVYRDGGTVAALPSGSLLQCCFAAASTASPGSYPISNQCDAVDEFGDFVPVICRDGTLTIEPASSTPMPSATSTASLTSTATPTSTSPACVGDCDGDGFVIINELVAMVNIALGSTPASACSAGDADNSGDIAVNELIQAVGNALKGCTA